MLQDGETKPDSLLIKGVDMETGRALYDINKIMFTKLEGTGFGPPMDEKSDISHQISEISQQMPELMCSGFCANSVFQQGQTTETYKFTANRTRISDER